MQHTVCFTSPLRPSLDYAASEPEGQAQSRFGNAKSISSDQYFEKGDAYSRADRDRGQNFDSATGISSDDYFGREKSPETSSELGSAKDLARKLYNSADIESIKDAIQSSSSKVILAMSRDLHP